MIGNLVFDPKSKTTNDGKIVTNFRVAVNRRQRDQSGNTIADYFDVSAWNALGENCQKYLAKGRKVAVTGPVSVRMYQANDGTTRASMEVMAQEVEFLSCANGGGQSNAAQTPAQAPVPAEDLQPNLTPVETDGELPF